jgi:transcriptional regulator with GAF, ATPase, and Fis domain
LIHDWPYNVRELEHALTVAAARAGGNAIRAHHLPPGIGDVVRARPRRGGDAATPLPTPNPDVPIALAVDRDAPTPGRDELLSVLRYYRGSVALTAGFFRRDRRQVYRWLDAHGIDPKAERARPD